MLLTVCDTDDVKTYNRNVRMGPSGKCLDTDAPEHMEEVGWHVSMSPQLEHHHSHSISTNRHLLHTSQTGQGREKGDSKTNYSLLQD